MTSFFEFPEEGTRAILGHLNDGKSVFTVPVYGLDAKGDLVTAIGILAACSTPVVTPLDWIYDPRVAPHCFEDPKVWHALTFRPAKLDS